MAFVIIMKQMAVLTATDEEWEMVRGLNQEGD
jgi:hypothetical protein